MRLWGLAMRWRATLPTSPLFPPLLRRASRGARRSSRDWRGVACNAFGRQAERTLSHPSTTTREGAAQAPPLRVLQVPMVSLT
jgi:hypothetical protein